MPSPDRRRLTIRCYWSGDDMVTDLMTPRGRLLAVPVDATAGEARLLCADYDGDHLIVVDGQVLVGVARRGEIEWAAPDWTMSSMTARKLWTINADATLADAGRIFDESSADCALVVGEDELLGLVTRSDLRDVGWHG